MSENKELTAESLIQRNEVKFLASALGEEIVMMNTDNGDYIGVNNIGSEVWNMLDKPITVDELTNKILDTYSGNEEDIKTDIDTFLQRMLKHEMLIVTA